MKFMATILWPGHSSGTIANLNPRALRLDSARRRKTENAPRMQLVLQRASGIRALYQRKKEKKNRPPRDTSMQFVVRDFVSL